MLYSKNKNYGVETLIPTIASLKPPKSDKNYMYFQAVEDGATVSLKSPLSFNMSLEISQDGNNWIDWEKTVIGIYHYFNKITLLKRGDYVFIRATNINTWVGDVSSYMNFHFGVKKIACGGNINSLINKNILVNTITATYCFYRLFYNCTSLTTAPELPATTLASSCYYSMFQGCTSLITAPELPATTLANYCYAYMFKDCTSLTTVPGLPATTLASYCYYYMFDSCKSLTSGSDLQAATILASNCCSYMYNGCLKLNMAWAPNVSSWTTSYFNNWLLNVASAGTLYKPSNLTDIPTSSPHGVPVGWSTETMSKTITLSASGGNEYPFSYSINGNNYSISNGQITQVTLTHPEGITIATSNSNYYISINGKYKKIGPNATLTYDDITNNCTISCRKISDIPNILSFTAQESNSTIGMNHYGTNTGTTKPIIYISTDNKATFTQWDYSTKTLANVGSTIYMVGENPNGISKSTNNYSSFVMNGKISATGNCMSLLWPDSLTNIKSYSFYRLFYNCTSLTTAPELPATTLAIYCYGYMFQNCTSLTTAPELPATTLVNNCYLSMFSYCTSLTTAPELPATTLAIYCYQSMFLSCINLTTAPELPATTLVNNCYQSMFSNCTSLTTAPELPATTLTYNCYNSMFYNCTSLTTAPELPATTLANYCYGYMFQGCSSLTTAPELPATTLADNCYAYMFQNCTSLTTAPELPATTLASYCYRYMFQNCRSINYIKTLATGWTASYAGNWVYNVASAGTFVKNEDTTIPLNSSDGVPIGWSVINYSDKFSFQAGNTTSQIKLSTPTALTITLETSTDKINWTPWNRNSNGVFDTITLQSGETVYIRGNNDKFESSTSAYSNFSFTGNTYCQGNIMYLLDKTGQLKSLSGKDYGFYRLFYNCTSLITAPELPATTLVNNCYQYMFQGCSHLITTPELPATTLAIYCYAHMFDNCTNLITAPELPATTLANYCYQSMFSNCTSLTTAPELPATTLKIDCYSTMFYNCTSLTTAPELPATTLASGCYGYMFYNCTSLTTAPELPATTLANYCYTYMFQGCSSLTTAPELPATTLADYCYRYMFSNCTSLTTAPELPATTLASSCYYSMFQGCTSLVTPPPELPATTLASSCYYSMFQGCTSLTTAPELPATKLADNCYQYMFGDCRGLTTAPELPATALTRNCYYYMFSSCSTLNYIKVFAKTWNTSYANNWVSNVSSNGTFYKPSSLSITSGTSAVPAGWRLVNF